MEKTTDQHLEELMNELTRRILDLGEELRPHDIQMTVSVGVRGLGNPHHLRGEIIVGLTPVVGQVDVAHRRGPQRKAQYLRTPTPEE